MSWRTLAIATTWSVHCQLTQSMQVALCVVWSVLRCECTCSEHMQRSEQSYGAFSAEKQSPSLYGGPRFHGPDQALCALYKSGWDWPIGTLEPCCMPCWSLSEKKGREERYGRGFNVSRGVARAGAWSGCGHRARGRCAVYTGMRRRVYVCSQVSKHIYLYPLTSYKELPSVLSWSLQKQSYTPSCLP